MLKTHFIGIYVSKDWLDYAIHQQKKTHQTTNDDLGFESMVRRLRAEGLSLENSVFCFEATGMYSTPLSNFLSSKNFKFIKAFPLDVKKSLGAVRGKNDQLDAHRLASYAYRKLEDIGLTVPETQENQDLARLNSLRSRLVVQRAGFKATLKEYKAVLKLKDDDVSIKVFREQIILCDKQIAEIEAQLQELIKNSPEMLANYNLLQTVVGIGPVVAINMIVYTQNFTKITDPRKFCSYSGLVPYDNQSGYKKGRKKISPLANKIMKSLLDRGALSALEHDADMKQYFNRKVGDGKEKRVVINAIRSKIVHRAFKVIKEKRPYIKEFTAYQQSLKNVA